MVRNLKWIKRCVLVIGVTATGLLAATYAQFILPHEDNALLSYAINSVKDERGVPKDFLLTNDLVRRNGFGYEQHKVTTEDGYILRAHRILTNTPGGPPVIFQHGFLAASDSLVIQKRNSALAFLLADAGFDVWLPDQRGDWYSRGHIKYKTSDPRYWDFSFHEAGLYDLPAYIDYILDITGYSQLDYIGHSMGTTVFLVMASLRPDYDKKIKAAVLLAPVATTPSLHEISSTPLRLFFIQNDLLFNTLKSAGITELLPRTYQTIMALRNLCGQSRTQDFCLDFVALGYGENRANLDRQMIGIQISYLPAGSSAKTAHHLSQIYKTGFRLYDYGAEENYRRYGSKTPPLYPLQNITTPIALYWAMNDMLVNEKSVSELSKLLPNVIKVYQIPDPKFTHVDYVFGLNNRKKVNEDIVFLLLSLMR